MNRIGKIIRLSILACLILLPAAVCNADKPVVIKIATLAPEGSSYINTLEALDTEIRQKTNNQVRLKIYAGGVLGDEGDMRRKMHIGQIQGAVLTSAGLSGLFLEMDVFQVPFLFETYNEIDYVVKKMDAFFREGFEKKGYVLVGWSEGGFVRLMSTSPVANLSDLKKLRVWSWADAPMAKIILDEAGVAAIPLSVPDVLVGLQTGLVDVVYAPPSAAISLQWFTKTKYMTDVPLIYLIGAIVIKKDVIDKISPAHRDLLKQSFQRQMEQLTLKIREDNQKAIEVMVKHGVKIIKPSTDQVEEFKNLSEKAMERLGDKSFSKKVKDEVTAHLQTYRSRKEK